MRLLIVEDDRLIAENLYDFLESRGHVCDYAHAMTDARRLLAGQDWDAVLLDRNLPDGDGLDLLEALRRGGNPVPVLVLTARGQLDERLQGFLAGADDYVVKPFALQEIEMRLLALHRRAHAAAPASPRTFGDLRLDEARQTIFCAGRPLALPPKAVRLLAVFIEAPQRLHSRQMLEQAVWGSIQESSDNLRTLLHTVRRALEGSRVRLVTAHGQGYSLEHA